MYIFSVIIHLNKCRDWIGASSFGFLEINSVLGLKHELAQSMFSFGYVNMMHTEFYCALPLCFCEHHVYQSQLMGGFVKIINRILLKSSC